MDDTFNTCKLIRKNVKIYKMELINSYFFMTVLTWDTIFMQCHCNDVSIHKVRYELRQLEAIHLDEIYCFSMNRL